MFFIQMKTELKIMIFISDSALFRDFGETLQDIMQNLDIRSMVWFQLA